MTPLQPLHLLCTRHRPTHNLGRHQHQCIDNSDFLRYKCFLWLLFCNTNLLSGSLPNFHFFRLKQNSHNSPNFRFHLIQIRGSHNSHIPTPSCPGNFPPTGELVEIDQMRPTNGSLRFSYSTFTRFDRQRFPWHGRLVSLKTGEIEALLGKCNNTISIPSHSPQIVSNP